MISRFPEVRFHRTRIFSFSNNLSENAVRPFTVGRKNWLFCDTPNGAQASAIVYTMVEMAKANGVNVYHYL
ncbi:MAG: transposase, partial [Blautia producta]|nr:transposase [Blautia producta]